MCTAMYCCALLYSGLDDLLAHFPRLTDSNPPRCCSMVTSREAIDSEPSLSLPRLGLIGIASL